MSLCGSGWLFTDSIIVSRETLWLRSWFIPPGSCWALILMRWGYRRSFCWVWFLQERVYVGHPSCWGRIVWETVYRGNPSCWVRLLREPVYRRQDSCWVSFPFQGRGCRGAQAFCWVRFLWKPVYRECRYSWGRFFREPVYREPDSELCWIFLCLRTGHRLSRLAAQLGLPPCGRELLLARSPVLPGHLLREIRLPWTVRLGSVPLRTGLPVSLPVGTYWSGDPAGPAHDQCMAWLLRVQTPWVLGYPWTGRRVTQQWLTSLSTQLSGVVWPVWHSHSTHPLRRQLGQQPGPGRQRVVNQQRGITDLGQNPLNPASLTWCQQHSTDTWQLLWHLRYPWPNRLWHLPTPITLETVRIGQWNLTVHRQWTKWCLLTVVIWWCPLYPRWLQAWRCPLLRWDCSGDQCIRPGFRGLHSKTWDLTVCSSNGYMVQPPQLEQHMYGTGAQWFAPSPT